MPPLPAPDDRSPIELPPRRGTVAASTQVLVVGGGPAGLAAAVGAAAAGADVVLVERCGFLGGNATATLVMPLMSFHAHRDHIPRLDVDTLLPADQGPGGRRLSIVRLTPDCRRRRAAAIRADGVHRAVRPGSAQAGGARPAR